MPQGKQQRRTVREIGGELWAELSSLPVDQLPWQTRDVVVDIVMGVLARHGGNVLENDRDVPVDPLPRTDPRQRRWLPVQEGADPREVFLLWHIRRASTGPHVRVQDLSRPDSFQVDTEEGDDIKLLGIYSSQASVVSRVERARDVPGFRDQPDSFHIDRYVLDRDEWSTGFGP
jgi:hypothetical protein